MRYRDWYNSTILKKIREMGYNGECYAHSIDCDDPYDIDAEVVYIPTTEEFIEWLLGKGEYFVSVNPEISYDFGYVFTYNVWQLSYDYDIYNDKYDLILQKFNFRTYQEAYEQAAYDLLMELK